MQDQQSASVSATLSRVIQAAIARQGGWLPFDRFMAMALYAPGLGYYAHRSPKFGLMPQSGSDFVTAPELSPSFGRAVARQIEQALLASRSDEVWEFGAGSGALAAQLLETLGDRVSRYTIIDLSGSLRERQRERLAPWAEKVRWLDAWPDTLVGVVVGNEVLDAMPVQLLSRQQGAWLERGVVATEVGFAWADRPSPLRPPDDAPAVDGAVIEVHPQSLAFVSTLAEHIERGAALFIDYGFPAHEYYHPQRHQGTLMCHRGHQSDVDPLSDVGLKDITAHVNFSAVALAAQDAGLEVIGYASQAHFLLNCGILEGLESADPRVVAPVQKLIAEHEMGELFKVLLLAKGCDASFHASPIGFTHGDRSHTL